MNINIVKCCTKKIFIGSICFLFLTMLIAGDIDPMQQINDVLNNVVKDTQKKLSYDEREKLESNAKNQIHSIVNKHGKILLKKIIINWDILTNNPSKTYNLKKELLLEGAISDMSIDWSLYVLPLAISRYDEKKLKLGSFENIFFRCKAKISPQYRNLEIRKLLEYALKISRKNKLSQIEKSCINTLSGESFITSLSFPMHRPSAESVPSLKRLAVDSGLGDKVVFGLVSQILGCCSRQYILKEMPGMIEKLDYNLINKNCPLEYIEKVLSTQPKRAKTEDENLNAFNKYFRIANSGWRILMKEISEGNFSLDQMEMIIDVLSVNIYRKEQAEFFIAILNDRRNKLSQYTLKRLSEKLLKDPDNIDKDKIISFLKKNKYMQ